MNDDKPAIWTSQRRAFKAEEAGHWQQEDNGDRTFLVPLLLALKYLTFLAYSQEPLPLTDPEIKMIIDGVEF